VANIRIGQSLRVRLSEAAKEYYHSRLVEHNAKEYFDVPLHHQDHRILEVAPKSKVWVEFQGFDGAWCKYAATFLESIRIPNLVWKITRPETGKITREQRREFVRVAANLSVQLDYTSEGVAKHAEVYSRDMSGGGMALYLPRHVILRPGLMVEMKFTLPQLPHGDFPVDVKSTVIRVSERNENGFAVGSFQFVNMKESVRQCVIQYTFSRQRALM
jgi:c-di-GMP-binding flagellar brake protein YcgR